MRPGRLDRHPYLIAGRETALAEVLRMMKANRTEMVLITKDGSSTTNILGVITLREVASLMQNIAHLLS